MTNRPNSISLGTNLDSVMANSARAVQHTNAEYNQQAYETYNRVVSEWKANNGMRWVNSSQMMKTVDPPPPPVYLPTDFGEIYSHISTNYAQGLPTEDVNAKRPYYMGGSIYTAVIS